MSRPLRIDFPGAWHHVMNRGARREAIYRSNADAESFLELVGEAGSRFGLETHAYCLMTNHYHLLVRSVDGTLSRAMRHIDGVHAQRFNLRHGLDGPLLRGRFRSVLVDTDRYFAAVVAYIHRNPLDARMVRRLQEHHWSSYPSYLGLRRPESWLDTSEVRSTFSNAAELRATTERLPLPPPVERFYEQERLGPVLGGEQFRTEAIERCRAEEQHTPHARQLNNTISTGAVIEAVADRFGVSTETIRRPTPGRRNIARQVAIALATDVPGRRSQDIAQSFGLTSPSSVDSARASLARSVSRDPELERETAAIRAQLEGKPTREPRRFET